MKISFRIIISFSVRDNFKLKDEVKLKSEVITNLETNLKAKDEVINKKEEYICQLRSELERLQTENEMKIVRIQELSKIISTTNKENQILSFENEEILDEKTQKMQEIKDLKNKVDYKHLIAKEQQIQKLKQAKKRLVKRLGKKF